MVLVFLISCPVLLILKKDSIAETMAIYAYYFLVITVLTQFRQLKAEDRSDIVEWFTVDNWIKVFTKTQIGGSI